MWYGDDREFGKWRIPVQTPAAAVDALIVAFKSNDDKALLGILAGSLQVDIIRFYENLCDHVVRQPCWRDSRLRGRRGARRIAMNEIQEIRNGIFDDHEW